MSGGLAPSKSTVYVSSLPFSLTNNDLHKIFAACGQVVKVTIMKDKLTRKSRGVAFVQFLERESAYKAVRSFNNTPMFGRTLKCNIAKDNGRAAEFIRRKNYTDKSRCYECGEEGHLSYACPKNALGEREPPPKKEKKRKKKMMMQDARNSKIEEEEEDSDAESGTEAEDPNLESLSAAIRFQQQLVEAEARNAADGGADAEDGSTRKKFRKDAYFSDEEELCD